MKKVFLLVVLFLAMAVSMVGQTSTPPTLDAEVSVDTGNAYGSTGKFARSFTNVDANFGSAITYTADTTNGDSFTINVAGAYAISYTDGTGTGDVLGISLNTSGTTSLGTLLTNTPADLLCEASIPAGYAENCSVTILLNVNDVIRACRATGGNSGANDHNIAARFLITKVR